MQDIQIFYQSDNSIIFNKSKANLTKTFNGLTNNKLINMHIISNYNSIVLIFERGDLFIIPTNFIESDLFEVHWNKILSNQDNLSSIESLIKTSFSDVTNIIF